MAAPSKRAALEKLLDQGMVMVHVDARRPGVRVPPAFRGDPQLRLNLSYRFASHDLAVSDDYVRCTLSFQGLPYYCELPLDALFAITSHVTGEALVWPEALAATLEPLPAQPAAMALATAPEEEPREEVRAGERTKSKPPLRNHLRLVK
jgi:stringent starvation protein B